MLLFPDQSGTDWTDLFASFHNHTMLALGTSVFGRRVKNRKVALFALVDITAACLYYDDITMAHRTRRIVFKVLCVTTVWVTRTRQEFTEFPMAGH